MLGTAAALLMLGSWIAPALADDPQRTPASGEPRSEVVVRAMLLPPENASGPFRVVPLDGPQGTPPSAGSPSEGRSPTDKPVGADRAKPPTNGSPVLAAPRRSADDARPNRDSRSPSRDADDESDDDAPARRPIGDTDPTELTPDDDAESSVGSEPELSYEFLGAPVPRERLDDLRQRVRRTLMHYHQRHESANEYSPWGIMHALIAYGVDTTVIADGKKVNAIGWLAWNGRCRGQQLMASRNGELVMNVGPGLQGHEGQFLAMLAQSYVPADYELRIGNLRLTVQDLIEYEQRTCRPKTELTFKLIAFAHYLPSDASWKSDDGQDWTIERLIREEIDQPVIGAACGGTHRLMGLSYAIRYRRSEGKSIDGEWARAARYVNDFQQHAIGLRNPDGSFSTKWLERREARDDDQRRIQTTGHILEWLVYSLPEEQLRSPEVVRTVGYLNDLLWNERSTKWEIGPKGHALHALNLYDQRVFGARIGQGGPRLEWR